MPDDGEGGGGGGAFQGHDSKAGRTFDQVPIENWLHIICLKPTKSEEQTYFFKVWNRITYGGGTIFFHPCYATVYSLRLPIFPPQKQKGAISIRKPNKARCASGGSGGAGLNITHEASKEKGPPQLFQAEHESRGKVNQKENNPPERRRGGDRAGDAYLDNTLGKTISTEMTTQSTIRRVSRPQSPICTPIAAQIGLCCPDTSNMRALPHCQSRVGPPTAPWPVRGGKGARRAVGQKTGPKLETHSKRPTVGKKTGCLRRKLRAYFHFPE